MSLEKETVIVMAEIKKVFTEAEKKYVWDNKATKVEGVDPDVFRQDYAGAWMRYADYGNRNSQYGWEIDHLKPLSQGGEEVMTNYLPLQWQNNVRKGDNYPRWATAVAADGQNNVEQEKFWKVNS